MESGNINDEDAAWVLRKVFHMAAKGISQSEIARQLNKVGIPTRYMYHRLKDDNFPDKQPHVRIKKWDSAMIRDTFLYYTFWLLMYI